MMSFRKNAKDGTNNIPFVIIIMIIIMNIVLIILKYCLFLFLLLF